MSPEPQQDRFLKSMQQVLFENSEFSQEVPEQGSVEDIRAYLSQCTTAEERIEWLARAYTLSMKSETDAELKQKQEQFLQTKLLLEKINQFKRMVEPIKRQADDIAMTVPSLVSSKGILTRQSGIVGYNQVALRLDSWTSQFGVEIAGISGFFAALKLFESEVENLDKSILDLKNVEDTNESFENFRMNVMGVLKTFDMILGQVDKFPKFCDELVTGVRDYKAILKAVYNSPEKEEEDAPSLFDLLSGGSGGPVSADVPIYKDNLFLTAFLHEFTKRIPEREEDSKGKKIEIEPSEIIGFARHFHSFADGKLLSQVRTPLLYKTLANGIEGLYSVYGEILKGYEQSDIKEVRDNNPSRKAEMYARVLEDSTKNALGGSIEGGAAFKAFDTTTTVDFLNRTDPVLKQGAAETENTNEKKEEISKRHKAFLEMFEKMEEMLERLARDESSVSEDETVEFVKALIEINSSMEKAEVKKRNSQLSKDKREGNYSFNVTQVDHGELKLKRVPSTSKGYDDMKGASWGIVKEKLDSLLEYSERSYIYSQMSPRGKINNNMLIVGPYGCGKNMFSKALMNDSRTVGVNVTLDRLLSMWHGKSEANVRDLFEQAGEKWVEYEKPVVIGWDEFDTLFGDKNGGMYNTDSIHQSMQKILQSVLDGDTIYEGVALISLTNEPLRIPVPIWRRFAHVEIIQPLSEEERIDLVKHTLSWLPKSENFDSEVDWDGFASRTDFASGDVIVKVFDRVFANYLSAQEKGNKDGLIAMNKEAKERVHEGLSFTPQDCAEVFMRHGSDIVVTPEVFNSSSIEVLTNTENDNAMKQQRRFYDHVEKRLEEAFSGDI